MDLLVYFNPGFVPDQPIPSKEVNLAQSGNTSTHQYSYTRFGGQQGSDHQGPEDLQHRAEIDATEQLSYILVILLHRRCGCPGQSDPHSYRDGFRAAESKSPRIRRLQK